MTISASLSLPYGWSKSRPMKWFSSYVHRPITANKAFEWQTDYFGWTNVLSISLDLIPTGSDHASLGFEITLLGFMVSAKIYDSRHWDTEAQGWEKYDDDSSAMRSRKWLDRRELEIENARNLLKDEAQAQVLNKMELQEFLQTPKGKAMIDQIVDRQVKSKLAAHKAEKIAKAARGEEYRRANLSKRDN